METGNLEFRLSIVQDGVCNFHMATHRPEGTRRGDRYSSLESDIGPLTMLDARAREDGRYRQIHQKGHGRSIKKVQTNRIQHG